MKKFVLLPTLLILMFLALCSCFSMPKDDTLKNEFYSADYLTELSVADLPAPPLYDSRLDGDTLYLNLTDEEYKAYAEAAAAYLASSTGIYHAGAYDSYEIFGLLLIPIRYELFTPLEYGYEINEASNCFAYARKEELVYGNTIQNYRLSDSVVLDISRESSTLEKAKFTYNTKISLSPSQYAYMSDEGYFRHSMQNRLDKYFTGAEVEKYLFRIGYCTVGIVKGLGEEFEISTVGDYDFTSLEGVTVAVHYYDPHGLDDKIMPLSEAYEKNYIYDYSIKEIYKIAVKNQ